MHTVVGSRGIDGHQLVPLFWGHFRHTAILDIRACRNNQNVDMSSQLFVGPSKKLIATRSIRYVDDMSLDGSSLSRFLKGSLTAPADQYDRPRLVESPS
jgi:hypothetical protein